MPPIHLPGAGWPLTFHVYRILPNTTIRYCTGRGKECPTPDGESPVWSKGIHLLCRTEISSGAACLEGSEKKWSIHERQN